MAAKVEIYVSPFCGYCSRAKRLLTSKGVDYIEYDVLADSSLRDQMQQRAPGSYTVPQIFIDGVAVGGSDDIHELDRQGKLDTLLAGKS
jgi:glutaredoxin 3